jgi:hypothetical protein
MFVQLATLLTQQSPPPAPPQLTQANAERVFDYHPIQLSRFLEQVWVGRNSNLQILTPTKLEIPNTAPLAFELESLIENDVIAAHNGTGNPDYPYPPPVWDHLIYAYMVENTRAYEIFRRVLEEYAYGERLGVPSDAGQHWLRATEALFYRDNPPFQIYSLASWIRPDIRAVRRNAYQRMFGLDLNHGTDDNRPYPYPRAAAANVEFSSTWEELLRQVWRAVVNIQNQVGPNETDITTIANLSRALFDMLRVRRQDNNAGNLGRDELFHVATMSWFHLTLMYNTPIVHDLKADATSPAERLQKIGERVGLPAHSRADSYFHLATSMSLVLREMELGTFNDTAGAPALFQTGSKFQQAMQEATTHWSVATGRDVKARPVTVAPSPPPPIRPTPAPMTAAPSRNGHRPHAPVRSQDTVRS